MGDRDKVAVALDDLGDSSLRVSDAAKLALRVRKRGYLTKGVGDRGQQAVGIASISGAVARAVRLRKHPAVCVKAGDDAFIAGAGETAIGVAYQGSVVPRWCEVTSKDSPLRVPQAGSIPLNQQDSAALGHNLLHTTQTITRTILASRTAYPAQIA